MGAERPREDEQYDRCKIIRSREMDSPRDRVSLGDKGEEVFNVGDERIF